MCLAIAALVYTVPLQFKTWYVYTVFEIKSIPADHTFSIFYTSSFNNKLSYQSN